MMTINSDIREVKGVGENIQKKLEKLGIKTIEDFLFYYPFRFENYGNLKKINELKLNDRCIFLARVELIESKRSMVKRKNFIKAIVKDDTGKIEIIWFNNPWVKNSIKSGELYYFIGNVSINGIKNIEIINPIFRKYNKNYKLNNEIIFPIYRTTNGLKQITFRNIFERIINNNIEIKEYLPSDILKKYNYLDINRSIRFIHKPQSTVELNRSIDRLKFDELFIYQLINELRKEINKSKKSISIKFFESETKAFINSLDFKLTNKQRQTSWEILLDMNKTTPMNRLLEGDVGSGKTIVFLIATLNVILNNLSVCIMAPTSILANQHYKKICELFLDKPYFKKDINICLLTSDNILLNNKKINKKELLKLINDGKVDVLIGTHALISNNINIKNLGLIVVDEQHRFGVSQRKRINENINRVNNENFYPHFLSVTATPIPRTLALTFYGDLDISILDEKPLYRKDIITNITDDIDMVYNFIKSEVEGGSQVYVICPLIECESDSEDIFELEIKSAKKMFDNFITNPDFKMFKIGLLHGRMRDKEKEKVENEFYSGNIDILISTSVVEVGIDVINANGIVIFGAEKFGLAQLYQLRGRVGRGDKQSYCLLYINSSNETTIHRLNNLVNAKSSFELAEMDIKERGFGEIYGLKQSGHIPELKIASFFDYEIINRAKLEARNIINKLDNYKMLKDKVEQKELDIHFE